MERAKTAAARAQSALGVRFTLNGASMASGFDCVGLAAFCYGLDHDALPRRAGLGRVAAEVWHQALAKAGFVPSTTPQNGDLLLLDCGRGRWHLAIQTERGLIHAHAGLGRVVLTPAAAPMRLLARFTLI